MTLSTLPRLTPTHEDLRKRAIRWLTNTMHCGVVLSEISSGCSEIPDAVGWRNGGESISVECKISRSDFHAQKDKIHVRCNRGVGRLRYFLVPKGLIQPAELVDIGPDGVKDWDYGLLWWSSESGIVKVVKEATPRDPCKEDEITMLVSALRRVRVREFLILVAETP